MRIREHSRTETKTIARLKRLANSKNGNPRYEVQFKDGTRYYTEPDAAIAGQLTNPEFQDRPIRVAISVGGRIYDAEPE